ncbi:MAG: class I SAM-dependent methyltransferase [Candidatus Heimdallarchaeota archaeon]|nr:class I SAM-dependent methyltransferase [Candidatus Heimdallarchaeota archaeon]
MNKSYSRSAQYYDFIYQNKAKEMYTHTTEDFLNLSQQILGRKPASILDIACGTGMHALELSKLGIEVTGIDLSKDQIDQAKKNAISNNYNIEFIQSDMSEFVRENAFDAAAAFFSGFCYLRQDQEVIQFLNNMRKSIKAGGFLYFEFWNILALHHNSKHFDEIKDGDNKLLRYHITTLDLTTGLAYMPMKHVIFEGNTVVEEFTEEHYLRCYTIPQLRSLIDQTEWKIKEIYALGEGSVHVKPTKDELRYFAVLN